MSANRHGHSGELIRPEPPDHITTRILTGHDARTALADDTFLRGWQELYGFCPWATVNQSPDFCVPWYEVFERSFEPVMVTGTDVRGKRVGLLALACDVSTGELVSAGGAMSEYEVWIATPHAGNTFIEAALDVLRERFPNASLRFLILPPKSPLEWTATGRWSHYCALRTIARPLIEVGDGSKFRESLRKRGNKSRINRLKQVGELQLRQLSAPQELEAVLDEVFDFNNFRLAAFHSAPISPQYNQLQKGLYLRLMRVPRLLHATTLSAGDRLISAHIGVYNKEEVLLGILAFSPFFAKHSPGKLHLLMLGEELAREGIPVFDLTPGGEYKENFATHHDTAYVLTVFFNRRQCIRYKATRMAIDTAKNLFGGVGSARVNAKDMMKIARHKWTHFRISRFPAKASKSLRKSLWYTGEMRIYAMDIKAARHVPHPQSMRRDCIQDLLSYEAAEAWQPLMSQFLKQALESLGSGAHVYTHAKDGRLLHYAWLIERQTKSFLTEVGQANYLPPDCAVIANAYTHPLARGRGLFHASLCQMLHDAARIPDTKQIYIGVMADNAPSRHVIEKLGFVYQYSFFQWKRLGRKAHWSNAPRWATRPPESKPLH